MADKEEKKKTRVKKALSKKTVQKPNKDQEELGLIPKEDSIVKETQSIISIESSQIPEQGKINQTVFPNNSDHHEAFPRYLSGSLNLLSFLSDTLELRDNKIIPAINISLLLASFDRVSKKQSDKISFENKFKLVFTTNNKEARDFGVIFFSLLSNERCLLDLENHFQDFYDLCIKLLSGIDRIKEGEKSLNIVLELLLYSIEIESFQKLKQYLKEYIPDQFSQLNDISEKIIGFLNETKLDDKYLNNWKTAIWAYLWVLRYSTQSSEILFEDLFKKKSSQFKELHIVLIGLFATKLFHSTPAWKPIGLSYQGHEKMKVLQPTAEVFYNPDIITSLSSDSKKQEEYFWTYIWGKPYSMFEKPVITSVKKLQKRMMEVEEEVVVEEKSFGDFIKVYGETKPTGVIHLRANV